MNVEYPEQLPVDDPDYDAYAPEPCPFCREDPCECDEGDDDASS